MRRTPRDDYYVLMWSFIDPLFIGGAEKAKKAVQRFRELAANGGTLIATFVNLESFHESLRQLGQPPITFTARDLGTFPYLDNDFPFYVENVVAPGGVAEWRPVGPLPKKGRLVCRDVASGVSAAVALA